MIIRVSKSQPNLRNDGKQASGKLCWPVYRFDFSRIFMGVARIGGGGEPRGRPGAHYRPGQHVLGLGIIWGRWGFGFTLVLVMGG